MTVLTAPAAHARTSSPHRLSFPHLLHSEWIKLTSLRSTWWSLGIAAALSVSISMMIAAASSSFPPGYAPINAILSPMQFTMLVAGILGAIAVTGEYSTGMIRSTLTADPRRGAVLAAKAVVTGGLMAAASVAIYAIAIAAASPLLSESIDWSDGEQSVIPLGYGVLSMVAFTLIGLGWGFIVRNGAGAIAATVGVLFVLPIVTNLFALAGDAWQWIVDLADYLPMAAASELTAPGAEDTLPALLALGAWVVTLLVAGWAVLRTRDA
jgi:ABC-2 type transport system permease protein